MRKGFSLVGLAYACAVTVLVCLPGTAAPSGRVHAEASLEARKQPMRFAWYAPERGDGSAGADCGTHCHGWVSAVGIITGDTPAAFADFAANHDLSGTTIVLDSSGGSVLDALKLGREWRDLGVTTTVGVVNQVRNGATVRAEIYPEAYCESMCVFLLLSGKTRYVPAGAHVRVHQIWMGDRADDATAANYSAQDVMIIERDVGRLAKYTFEMGGSGELLGLALSIPPWEPLRELTPVELRLTNLVAPDAIADVARPDTTLATRSGDKAQDRITSGVPAARDAAQSKSAATSTADALPAEQGQRNQR